MFKRHSDQQIVARPMLCSLTGFLDAGFGAKIATDYLLKTCDCQLLYSFNVEKYLDFRQRRPAMLIKDGQYNSVEFEKIEVFLCKDSQDRDFLLMVGPEPDLNWKKFAKHFKFLLSETLPEIFINLGAFPAPAPHTRPIKIAAISPYKDLVESIGFVRGAIEVPASVGSYLSLICYKNAIAAVGLWARVPHYVSQGAYYPGALALLEQVTKLTGLVFDLGELIKNATQNIVEVDEMVSKSEEHKKLISLLEAGIDAAEGSPLDIVQIPSGDEIAKELEKFLKEQGNQGD
jgi:hypothetical protein